MTDEDREQVYLAVLAALGSPAPIVISHGTDTMIQTGLYLEPRLPHLEVPIILTGAMTPLGFEGTDGLQNLTESLITARLLQPGIHVVMHSQIFPIRNVRKNRELSQFVWADG
jgi:L-asparaginase